MFHRRLGGLAAVTILLTLAGCGPGGGNGGPAGPAPAASSPAAAELRAPTGELGSASITGTVRYDGLVPTLMPIDMQADPGCAKMHDKPPRSEAFVLNADYTIGNVFVRVTGGVPGGTYAPPAEPAVIDQHGCRYVPHVLGLMVGQPLKVLNSDGLLHNVHALPKVNKTFNMAMPASRTEAETTFDEEEFMFRVKCDVHPWMGAYVSVLGHPFFDVTGRDGTFEIRNLPAGSYEIEAWQEKLGTLTKTVEVAEGETATVDFTYSR